MKDNNIKIMVVTHKKYTMPEDKELYLPIQTGAAILEDLGIQRDDEGDNISNKNIAYNELCPMYWAWKNLNVDYIGVCHYRRLLSNSKKNGNSYNDILKKDTIEKLIKDYDIILPPKKDYYFSTVKKHYINSISSNKRVHANDMQMLEKAIENIAPEYLSTYRELINSSSMHMLHVCVMKKEKYDEYCSFMFEVMFETEKLLKDRKNKNRYIGALSEFLMDVWIKKNGYDYYELGLVELEYKGFFEKAWRVLKKRVR